MNMIQYAEQFRRAVQMFAESLTDDLAIEIATIYDEWKPDTNYPKNKLLRYGLNGVGDPQLYKTTQAHTSQSDWAPDKTPALYVSIGLNDAGYAVWSAPTGAHDAYNTGDIVDYNGTLYISKIDGNCTVPGTDARYWQLYEA